MTARNCPAGAAAPWFGELSRAARELLLLEAAKSKNNERLESGILDARGELRADDG
jgi:hypothetical protein